MDFNTFYSMLISSTSITLGQNSIKPFNISGEVYQGSLLYASGDNSSEWMSVSDVINSIGLLDTVNNLIEDAIQDLEDQLEPRIDNLELNQVKRDEIVNTIDDAVQDLEDNLYPLILDASESIASIESDVASIESSQIDRDEIVNEIDFAVQDASDQILPLIESRSSSSFISKLVIDERSVDSKIEDALSEVEQADAPAAKGDLKVASGLGKWSRLTVGTNGYVPVADSTASTGLAYRKVAPAAPVLVRQVLSHMTSANGTSTVPLAVDGSIAGAVGTNVGMSPFILINSGQYDVAGWTTKFFLQGSIWTNNVDPNADITIDLRAVTPLAGGAGVITGTLGSSATGSSITVTNATLGANTLAAVAGNTFDKPSDGAYIICGDASAGIAASSAVYISVGLFVEWI